MNSKCSWCRDSNSGKVEENIPPRLSRAGLVHGVQQAAVAEGHSGHDEPLPRARVRRQDRAGLVYPGGHQEDDQVQGGVLPGTQLNDF